ncbi:MAG TPA: hypothetical protein VF746_25585 [Longimicrobium sp.]|jgi:hypothetical protein
MSKSRYLAILALSAFVGLTACGGDDADGDDATAQDTSVVAGQDTINQPTVVPTQDSVVTTTDVDTIQGEADDDTTAKDTTP